MIDNATTFRQLLGTNLEQLSFEERQVIAQCLISKIVVTGEEVDIYFILPFDFTPQVVQRLPQVPEGTPGYFYRLRLAHFHAPADPHWSLAAVKGCFQERAVFDHPPIDGRVIHVDLTFEHEFFDVARAQRVGHIPPHAHQNNIWREMGSFEADRHRLAPLWQQGVEGETIPQIASNENLRQNPLASRLKTSQSNVVRLEKGRSLPSTRTLQRIAKATGPELVITFTRAA